MNLHGRAAGIASLAWGEGGQAAVEYALILALVVAGLIAVYAALGTTCVRLYSDALDAFAG